MIVNSPLLAIRPEFRPHCTDFKKIINDRGESDPSSGSTDSETRNRSPLLEKRILCWRQESPILSASEAFSVQFMIHQRFLGPLETVAHITASNREVQPTIRVDLG